MKKVLVIGSGGREHAIAKAFLRSQHVDTVFVAPGNVGMSISDPAIKCVPIAIDDFDSLSNFVIQEAIDLTFVGPEIPLSLGIVNFFNDKSLKIVGPSKEASQLEASKSFAKNIMTKASVPTAKYRTFNPGEVDDAIAYLNQFQLPIVIKEDGLAAGKGVIIAASYEEAYDAVNNMLTTNQSSIVIEEFLEGEEFSYFFFVNGTHILPITTARDYKRAFDQDQGLNTGGMGAFAPVGWVTEDIENEVLTKIIQPLAKQMVKEGTPYTGVLYAGLMQTKNGVKVIEFNARFGDPETQIVLPLLDVDFYNLVEAHLKQSDFQVKLLNKISLGVVLAAQGYPGDYQKGMTIDLEHSQMLDKIVFAGVIEDENNNLVANGGRILMVTSMTETIDSCRQDVYEKMNRLTVDKTFYRKDIGLIRGVKND